MPLLGRMSLHQDWRPRSCCSSNGCVAPPSKHFRLETGYRDEFFSFCDVCSDEVLENVPAWCVLSTMADEELEVAEVMAE